MIETSFTLFSLRILIKRLLNHENNKSFIEANLNNVQGRPRPVKMGYDKWSKLSSEEKSTWNKINDKSKRIILGTSHGTAVQDPDSYNPLNNRLMPPSHRRANAHHLD